MCISLEKMQYKGKNMHKSLLLKEKYLNTVEETVHYTSEFEALERNPKN